MTDKVLPLLDQLRILQVGAVRPWCWTAIWRRSTASRPWLSTRQSDGLQPPNAGQDAPVLPELPSAPRADLLTVRSISTDGRKSSPVVSIFTSMAPQIRRSAFGESQVLEKSAPMVRKSASSSKPLPTVMVSHLSWTHLIFGPAKVWRSLTPFVSTRHAKALRDGRPKMGANGWQTVKEYRPDA
jgi:hypothetical protein